MCHNAAGAVDRRTFIVRFAGASAGAVFFTACAPDELTRVLDEPKPAGVQTVALAALPGLASIGGRDLVNPQAPVPIGVTRIAATSFSAFSMACARCFRGDVRPSAIGYECTNIFCGWSYAADGSGLGAASARSLSAVPVSFDADSQTLRIG